MIQASDQKLITHSPGVRCNTLSRW